MILVGLSKPDGSLTIPVSLALTLTLPFALNHLTHILLRPLSRRDRIAPHCVRTPWSTIPDISLPVITLAQIPRVDTDIPKVAVSGVPVPRICISSKPGIALSSVSISHLTHISHISWLSRVPCVPWIPWRPDISEVTDILANVLANILAAIPIPELPVPLKLSGELIKPTPPVFTVHVTGWTQSETNAWTHPRGIGS
jgi:hypothetical protein